MRARSTLAAALAAALALLAPRANAELAAVLNEDGQAFVGADTPLPPPPTEPSLPQGLNANTVTAARASAVTNTDSILKAQITFWHKATIRAHLIDYSQDGSSTPEGTVFNPRVPGPCYVSRAFAMVHIAMFDAYVGITRSQRTYLAYKTPLPRVEKSLQWIAIFFAVRRAATNVIDREFRQRDRPRVPPEAFARAGEQPNFFDVLSAISVGNRWGETVASRVIAERNTDGAFDQDAYTDVPDSDKPRAHRPDPTITDAVQENYAAHWGEVPAFGYQNILSTVSRIPAPGATIGYGPGPDEDFQEVKKVGEVNAMDTTPQMRTQAQTNIGIFWAYDGAFKIGTPPRLYNDALDGIIASFNGLSSERLVRLYAVANIAMADAAIAAWREKYFHNFWRPTVGIRNEVPPFEKDENWEPLGVPKTNSNLVGETRNPSFPAYPSGHATIGTAAFAAAKAELGVGDSFRFSFTSAEFDGELAQDACDDPNNNCPPRPRMNRSFTIGQAIEENELSRIYLGVHWRMDSTQGGALGDEIGGAVSGAFPGKVAGNRG